MSRSLRNLIAGVLFIVCAYPSYGQSECDQALSHAESEFNAGHFYAIPSILKDCPEGKLSRENTVKAYLLLCQAYLILDNPIAADDSYLRLLKADPEYVANEGRDPIDVVYLSKKFTATPIFTPHFRLGFNTSIYRNIYSVDTEPYATTSQSSLRLNVQIGAGIDWNINDNISLCVEGNFASKAYKRLVTGISPALKTSDEQSVLANQFWLDFPVYLKWSDNSDRNIRPFGYAGFAINYLLTAKNEFVFTDFKPGGSQVGAVGPSESVVYQRNSINRSWVVGGGAKYKWGRDFLYVDVRYMGGLSNLATENKIFYADPTTASSTQIGNPQYLLSPNDTKYRYVSDLFRMDNISLSFGYIHPIYNPRKAKKARTKSVSRMIRRNEGGSVK